MKRKIIATIVSLTLLAGLLTGCGNTAAELPQDTKADETVQPEADPAEEEESTIADAGVVEEESAEDTEVSESDYDDPNNLPTYSYQGTEPYMDVICDYLVESERGNFSDAGVFIPFGLIVEVDDSDPKNIIAYGAFDIEGFDLYNTTLISTCASYGSGAIYLETNDDGTYTVTDSDIPLMEEECREVFAPVKGLYEKVTAASDREIPGIREQAIADYINTNGLNITQWQDFGHLPVPVLNAPPTPEEAQFYHYVSKFGYEITYDLRALSLLASDEDDMYGTVEETWTGTLMVIEKQEESDADAAIAAALSDAGAGQLESTAATVNGIECRRAVYDEQLDDGRIFRYICYAVPAGDQMFTIRLDTTWEAGVSEMTADDLDQVFESTLATFKVL